MTGARSETSQHGAESMINLNGVNRSPSALAIKN